MTPSSSKKRKQHSESGGVLGGVGDDETTGSESAVATGSSSSTGNGVRRHRKNKARGNKKHSNDPSSSSPSKRSRGDRESGGGGRSLPETTCPPSDLILTGSIKRGLFECDYCRKDISQVPRIRCAVCPDFDSCLDCFATIDPSAASSYKRHQEEHGEDSEVMETNSVTSTGTASGHNSSHGYRVSDSTKFPVLPSKAMEESDFPRQYDDEKKLLNVWTVEEDLRLLDSITSYGLGNWLDVSESVGGHKTPRKCMERYCDDFLGRYGHILSDRTIVEVKSDQDNSDDNDEDDSSSVLSPSGTTKRKKKKRVNDLSHFEKTKAKTYTMVLTDTLPEYHQSWPDPYLPPINVQMGQEIHREATFRAEQSYVKAVSQASNKEEALKLQQEWNENSSDVVLPISKVLPPRLEDIRSLKGSELAGFVPRRGDFDVEWDNDAEQILADMEFSPKDHPNERKLKLEIIDIYNTKLDERVRRKKFLKDWDLLDYKKNQIADNLKPKLERELIQRMRLFARFHTKEQHDRFLNDILHAKELRKEIAKLQFYRSLGMKSLSEAEGYELDKKRREHHKQEHIKGVIKEEAAKQQAERASKENSVTCQPTFSTSKSERKIRKSLQRGESLSSELAQTATEKDCLNPNYNLSDQITTQIFDITVSKHYTLLSAKEKKLCTRLQLMPDHYLQVKKALIKESFQMGILDKEKAEKVSSIVKIDIVKKNQVYDFILRCGWIKGSGESGGEGNIRSLVHE